MKALLSVTVMSVSLLAAGSAAGQHPRLPEPSPKNHLMDSAALFEKTEMLAWRDLIDAAPDTFRISHGLRYCPIGGGLAINFAGEPIPLFNRVIGLGIEQPLNQQLIDEIKSFYQHREKYIVHYSTATRPSNADSLLLKNSFYLAGSWERVVRGDAPASPGASGDIVVRLVDEGLKEKWVRFLIDTYGFDFYSWPRSFADRPGWKHYVAMKNDTIIACRSFFMTGIKTVFSGVDAPVPGVMTQDCNPDFAIWRRAIHDLLNEGARLFVADIERPDKENNKAAYDGFHELGFEIPYTRYHYRLNR